MSIYIYIIQGNLKLQVIKETLIEGSYFDHAAKKTEI